MNGDLLKRAVTGLLGAAFGFQALDDEKEWWGRLGYGLVAFDLVRRALNPTAGKLAGSPERALSDGGRPSAPLSFQPARVNSLDERVARIHEQMLTGVKDPKVYSLARTVLTRKCGDSWCVPEKDSLAEIRAVFSEVRTRVRYTWDPVTYDAFQTPQRTLELAAGDCDDMVSLLGAMLMSIGYTVRSRVVWTKGFSTWNHIYLLVQLPSGEWMALDATVDQPAGWEVPKDIMLKEPRDFAVQE